MNDPIERQAAIDTLFELYEYQRDIDPTEAADLVRQGILLAEKRIEKLPSAQPEIIRCKDCKYWTKQEDSLQGRCALFGIYPTGRWYCANADVRGEKENENNIQ